MQIEDSYKLSSMQEGMLFHSLYEHSPGIYIEQIICRLQENLNIFALKQSWQKILERHSILRTSFHENERYQLRQLVQKQVDLPLEEKDWRELPRIEQQKRLEVYLQQDRQQGFNIAEVPLMRLVLFQLAENDYKLIWTFHHALLDGRSILIILKEVFAFYEAFNQNQDFQIRSANSYRDYIDWLEQQSLTEAKEFWQQQLQGFKVLTQISELKHPELKFGFNKTQKLKISQASTLALKALAQKYQLTLNTLVQGAWALLLNRYSGKNDVVFGATRACRHSALSNMESRVGLFINTLPMRVQINSELSLLDWLTTLRSQWVTLRDYEHTPLVKIQEWSGVPFGTPLFESLLVFENYTLNEELKRQGENWKYREFNLLEQPSYPLNLAVYAESELLLKIDYDCRRFDDVMIARMLRHIETLLNSFYANPKRNLGECSLLTEAERHQLLVEWNDTQVELAKDKCIHELFESQVEKTPGAVAVVFEEEQLTYKELNNRANQLAHYLQKMGVKPEMLVGICMERSLEMVVSLLGVLKAGGAYVPIDPTYPKERLVHLISDSQMLVLLTQQNLLDRLPENKARIVCLDEDWKSITQESKKNPISDIKCDNLSYVIYTSGTTGHPKGVMIEHCSVLNLAMGLHQSIYTSQSKNHLQVSLNGSLAFDTSVKQIIQLLFGHTLEIIPEDLRFDGVSLLSYLRSRQIDVLDCTPSQLELLISAGILDSSIAPQYVLIGGESINQFMWKSLSQVKHIQFFNVYGPTECTVDSTFCDIRKSKVKSVIGRPIQNTKIYILDSQLRPIPIGIPGELHIGGAGLAREYLNRPELTAEKFISNPFSDEPGARLYKTGDRVRYLPDGNIEFLGRIDNQVKIRGFRIELGEIEKALGQHPAIQECVVIAQEEEKESKRLVSYLVSSQENISVSEVRNFLKQKLPGYMIPSAFVQLEAIPLTPNGKIDRKALSKIDWTEVRESTSFVAPRTPVEEIMVGIWSEVLGLKQIGIYDNFFELGGHSLKATQVISRIRDVFSFELPVRCLFDFPTVIDLSKQIEKSRSQKSNLATAIPLQPISREEELSVSFAQQRLWFLNQLEGQNTTYNILSGLHLSGILDEAALKQSVFKIVERHENLRTNFSIVHGVPIQVIQSKVDIPVSLVNLEILSECEQDAEVQRLIREEKQHFFDLTHDLLLRITLVRLGKESHILLVTMHHIVTDGWSMGIFFREVSCHYADFLEQKSASLPSLSIQYADFAHWQRQWLQGKELETQLKYWKNQLAGIAPLLDLPTVRPRPPIRTFQGSTKIFELSGELTQQIKKLSSQLGTTLFMTLLAVFTILLSRYSGQEDIVVGSPIAGRNHREIESLIGFFVNTIVLRVNLEGDPSFSELIKQTQQVALDAYTHQDLPFEKLVEELQPERNLSYNPLFQVMFVLQNTGSKDWEIPGLTVIPLEIEDITAKFDLTLVIEDTKQGLKGRWQYSTDLFDETAICRMSGHFQTLLEAIITNPQQRVWQLPILTEAERHQLLVEWNDTQVEFPKDKCIHELFEEQVEKTPDAIAVVFEEQQLTYKELNSRANQLAHYLQNLGVKPEVMVGICVKRSLEMIVGLLGILKAGGAYLPLDPSYPQERLSFMLEDAQISLLLTQQQLMEYLPDPQVRIFCLDTDWQDINRENQNNPTSSVNAENLAYVMYTSGSTGQPKGVCVIHQGVVRLVKNTDYGSFTSEEVFLQLAPIAFDASTFEIWGSLLNGAKLVFFPCERASLPELGRIVQQNQITTLWLTAGLFHLMVDERLEDLKSLNQLLAGGDILSVPHVQKVLANLDGCQLINGYGPTENTTFTCCYPITQAESVINSVPIGRPIANTQVYILDSRLKPVPIGVPGELYLGGAGLARGYLNRPELTAEKFIANPFSDDPYSKLYKTGDKGRYLPDGSIEFLGRIDNQVKIRGFRIELSEVEVALAQHPDVQKTVVIAREDYSKDKRLVAYIVTAEHAVSIIELRRFLKQKLPEYMVPSAFVELQTIPLTPNGKIDRRALPLPNFSHSCLEVSFVSPRTPTEEILATIWSYLLGVEQVGIYDNFFELGGHSLLATRLMFQISEVFHLELSLSSLFENPTIEKLAAHIDRIPKFSKDLALLPRAKRNNEYFPLSFHQQHLWCFEKPKKVFSNCCFAIRIIGLLNVIILERAINEIVKRHEALRTNFMTQKGRPIQKIKSEMILSLPIFDFRKLSEKKREIKVRQYAIQEFKHQFDLTQDSLVRLKLLHLREEEYILLLTVDHIIFDGWSLSILLKEISLLYKAISDSQSAPLLEPSTQYSEFVLWEQKLFKSNYFNKLTNYWKKRLDKATPLLKVFEINERNLKGKRHQFSLPVSLYKELKALSHIQNVTLFMTLLAAFKVLLYHYTGKEDILVASMFANRRKKEFNNVIGFFTNIQVLRTNLSGNLSFRELLNREREVVLQAHYHQEWTFPLIDAEQSIWNKNYLSLIQVMFHLQYVDSQSLSLPKMQSSFMQIDNEITTRPLSLFMNVHSEKLSGFFNYSTDLFSFNLIAKMTEFYTNLLEIIVSDINIKIDKLYRIVE